MKDWDYNDSHMGSGTRNKYVAEQLRQKINMIVNLVGPPAAGKSTFASRFILQHPQFKYCPIDEYRIQYQEEAHAWSELTKDVLSRRHCVIESCGMGWRLRQLLDSGTLRRRPLLTIAFVGDRASLLKRLEERQKRPLPEPFSKEDEILALDYAREHLFEYVKTDKMVCTTNKTKEEVYCLVNRMIQDKLLLTNGQKQFRRESFPANLPSSERRGLGMALQL